MLFLRSSGLGSWQRRLKEEVERQTAEEEQTPVVFTVDGFYLGVGRVESDHPTTPYHPSTVRLEGSFWNFGAVAGRKRRFYGVDTAD